MNQANPVDPRTLRTRNIIKATFKDMIRTMDADKISISDIAGQAGINRKTFYLHYSCREDLFKDICDEFVQRYSSELFRSENAVFETGFYRSFYAFLNKQDLYIERILCHPSYHEQRDYIISECAKINREHGDVFKNMSEDEKNLFDDTPAMIMFNVYRRWVALGKTIPLEVLGNFAMKMAYYGLSYWLGPHVPNVQDPREIPPELV